LADDLRDARERLRVNEEEVLASKGSKLTVTRGEEAVGGLEDTLTAVKGPHQETTLLLSQAQQAALDEEKIAHTTTSTRWKTLANSLESERVAHKTTSTRLAEAETSLAEEARARCKTTADVQTMLGQLVEEKAVHGETRARLEQRTAALKKSEAAVREIQAELEATVKRFEKVMGNVHATKEVVARWKEEREGRWVEREVDEEGDGAGETGDAIP